jgi:hypothetical protein
MIAADEANGAEDGAAPPRCAAAGCAPIPCAARRGAPSCCCDALVLMRAVTHAWPEAPPNDGADKANGEAKDSRTLYIEQLRAEAAGARAHCAAARRRARCRAHVGAPTSRCMLSLRR